MNEEWWEKPVCVLCDWWFIILPAIVLLASLPFWLNSLITRPGSSIVLIWEGQSDLDLTVVTPSGAIISQAKPRDHQGAVFVQDANRDCISNSSTTPEEKIVWLNSIMPDGQYLIRVTFNKVCESTPAKFKLDIAEGQKVIEEPLSPHETREFCITSPTWEECNP
jgi:hypothetical protein